METIKDKDWYELAHAAINGAIGFCLMDIEKARVNEIERVSELKRSFEELYLLRTNLMHMDEAELESVAKEYGDQVSARVAAYREEGTNER